MKKKNIIAILIFFALSVAMITPQLVQHSIILGADSLFHFNRFLDTEQQIAHGNIQYFISTYGYSQSGRIVNALYGPYLAYFNGFLLYLVKSWFWYQILSGILVAFIAGTTMYHLSRTNHVQYNYSVFISALYMMTYGITTWITGQQFLAWGAMIIPLGLSVATRLIRDAKNPIKVLEMTLVTSLFVETHVLSTLFLILIYLIFFMIALFTVQDVRKLFKSLFVSIIVTIVLTSNVWLPMIDLYRNNHLMSPFKNNFPLQNGMVYFSDGSRLTLILFILFVIQIGLVILKITQNSFLSKMATVLGGLILIATFPLLPWNAIFSHLPFISIIQFPYRLLPFAEALLLLGLGMTLTSATAQNRVPQIYKLIMFVIIVASLTGVQQSVYNAAAIWQSNGNIIRSSGNVTYNANGEKLRQLFQSKNLSDPLLSVWKPVSDYVPLKKDVLIAHPYNQYNMEIVKNKSIAKKSVKGGIEVKWMSSDTKYHNIGVLKYADTQLNINGHKAQKNQYYTTDIGTVMFKSTIGKNIVTVTYHESALMKATLALNIVSWIIVTFVLIFRSIQKLNKKLRLKS